AYPDGGDTNGHWRASSWLHILSGTTASPSGGARLGTLNPRQHVLQRPFGALKLLRVGGAQHHVGIWPVFGIEEGMAPDRHAGMGLGDLAELGCDITFPHP